MNLRQANLVESGFSIFRNDLSLTGLPRQIAVIDIDAVDTGNKRVYKFSNVLWMDLDHLHFILANILNGIKDIGKPIVESVNLGDAINLIHEMKTYGIENVSGIEGLVFWCLVHDRFTTFRHFLWNVWYSYSNRVNLYTGAGTQVPGVRAITPDEMDCDNIDGEAVRARGINHQGRWIDVRTGNLFVMPPHVVFSPYESTVVDLTVDSDSDDDSTDMDSEDATDGDVITQPEWNPDEDEVYEQPTFPVHRRVITRRLRSHGNSEVLSLEEAITQEPNE